MEEMKRIFVVDGCLKITPVQIPKSSWQQKVFSAKIGNQSILVLKQGWSKVTTYGGFATKPGAQHFKELVQKVERKRRREARKQRMAINPAV